MKAMKGTLSIKIDQKYLEFLKMKSHQISTKRNQDLSLGDIIRELIEKEFPMNTYNK